MTWLGRVAWSMWWERVEMEELSIESHERLRLSIGFRGDSSSRRGRVGGLDMVGHQRLSAGGSAIRAEAVPTSAPSK